VLQAVAFIHYDVLLSAFEAPSMIQPGNAALPADLHAFEGYVCPGGLSADYLDFEFVAGKRPAYVFVSGTGGNPFGHCLFRIHPNIGYVHAAQPGMNPALYLPVEEWNRYLLECKKTLWEVKEIDFQPDKVEAVRIKVNDFVKDGFYWVPWHDCVTMVDELATVGGSAYVAKTVFPSTAVLGFKVDRTIDTIKAMDPMQAMKDMFGFK
jgi:hypothetical protein